MCTKQLDLLFLFLSVVIINWSENRVNEKKSNQFEKFSEQKKNACLISLVYRFYLKFFIWFLHLKHQKTYTNNPSFAEWKFKTEKWKKKTKQNSSSHRFQVFTNFNFQYAKCEVKNMCSRRGDSLTFSAGGQLVLTDGQNILTRTSL